MSRVPDFRSRNRFSGRDILIKSLIGGDQGNLVLYGSLLNKGMTINAPPNGLPWNQMPLN